MRKQLKFYWVVLLFFMMSFATVNSEIFKDALFLSTYPNTWLPYLFLSIFALNLIVFMAVSRLLKKGRSSAPRLILIILTALVGAGAYLQSFGFYWFPFVFAVYLSTFPTIFTFLLFHVASSSFHIREFKEFSPTFRAGASLGTLLGAFMTPAWTAWLGSGFSLYLALFGLCAMAAILYRLPPGKVEAAEKQKEKLSQFESSLKAYPSLKLLLPLMVFISIGYFQANYLIKNQLTIDHSRDEIASFLGYLVGITCTLSFLIQTFVSQKVIHRFGVVALFYIAPTVILGGALFSIFYASVLSLALYFVLVTVALYCFNVLAADMALSPLPLPIRLTAKMVEEGVLVPLGQGIVAVFFIGISFWVKEPELRLIFVAVFTLIYAVPWYWMIYKLHGLYQRSLEAALQLRGFGGRGDLIQNMNDENKEKMAKEIVQHRSSRLYPIAFSLIRSLDSPSPELLSLLIKKVGDPDVWTRFQSIKALDEKIDGLPLSPLIEQFKNEPNEEVAWSLAQFFKVHYTPAVHELMADLSKGASFKEIYLVHPLLAYGGKEERERGTALLQKAFTDKRGPSRLAALRVWGENALGDLEEGLGPLIADHDPQVATEALRFAAKRQLLNWVPAIIKELEIKGISREAAQSLHALGPAVIPDLWTTIQTTAKASVRHAAVNLICSFSGEEAEKAILRLAGSPDMIVRSTAAFPKAVPRSEAFRQEVYTLIFEEAARRQSLRQWLQKEMPDYLRRELKIRLHMSSLRLIAWYGSWVNPEGVIKLLPLLNGMEIDDEEASARVHTALEFLNSLTSDQKLRYIFSTWHKEAGGPAPSFIPYRGDDRHLGEIITYAYRQDKSTMNEVMTKWIVLRESPLFEKLPGEVLMAIAEKRAGKRYPKGR